MNLKTKSMPEDLRLKMILGKGAKITAILLLNWTFQASASESYPSKFSSVINLKSIQREIKGKVTDEAGKPVVNANVHIKGSKESVQTDNDGNFTINSSVSSPVLVISFVGMETTEVKASGGLITFFLKEEGQKMNEVIVVGYGKQKKSDLTGSVSSVSKENLNLGGTVSNVGQALQGRTSGVQVQQNSFAPGST